MNIELRTVNEALTQNRKETVLRYEEGYRAQVEAVAREIIARREESPVVLLSGPSGSGKTTTGTRLREKIAAMGVPAHLISMDNYYVDWNIPDFPRLPDGRRDLESPLCLNIPLLNEHFSLLEKGVDIQVPIYDFPTHKPLEDSFIPMSPSRGDVFIFEGIHALNPLFTEKHSLAFRLYVSPGDSITWDGETVCDPGLLRLMRRVVRDQKFRGAPAAMTLALWGNVIASEKVYIEPYRESAHAAIRTALGHEVGAMKPVVEPLFRGLDRDVVCREQVDLALKAVALAEPVEQELLPPDSLIREFLG